MVFTSQFWGGSRPCFSFTIAGRKKKKKRNIRVAGADFCGFNLGRPDTEGGTLTATFSLKKKEKRRAKSVSLRESRLEKGDRQFARVFGAQMRSPLLRMRGGGGKIGGTKGPGLFLINNSPSKKKKRRSTPFKRGEKGKKGGKAKRRRRGKEKSGERRVYSSGIRTF